MSVGHTYHYEPLKDPSRQIRLLKLDSTRDNGSVLTGSLSVYKVPPRDGTRMERLGKHLKLPGYIAISYVWGSGPDLLPSHEIILDNRRFPITANLHAALHFYRASGPFSWRIWVDAICINQEDDAEKSAQVPIMRDIYHLAWAVAVWLGNSTPEVTRLIKFIDNLVNDGYTKKIDILSRELLDFETNSRDKGERKKRPLMERIRSESERLLLKTAAKSGVSLVRGVQIGLEVAYNSISDKLDGQSMNSLFSDGGLRSWEEIKSWSPNERQAKLIEEEDLHEIATLLDKALFTDNQYFSRMWTMQEICVANMGIVQVLDVNFDDFLLAVYYLQRQTSSIRSINIEKLAKLYDLNASFVDGKRQPLRTLLAISAGRESKDPRDRIYGLHGLMKDEETPLLKPDYAKPVAEVYANVARHIIFSEKSLDVLCGHQPHDRFPELPSWVTDFRHFGLNTSSLVQASGENNIYHASLTEEHALPEHPFATTPEWQILTVTGISLGTVSVVSKVFIPTEGMQTNAFSRSEKLWSATLTQSERWTPEELHSISTISDLIELYAEFYQNSNRPTFWTRNPDKLARLRALVANINNQNDNVLEISRNYLLTLLCGRIDTRTRCSREEVFELLTRSCIPDPAGIETLEKLCKALEDGTRGRRLIMVEGKRIGAAAEGTQNGDLVYVLMGCSVPVILRKTEKANEFKFVCECYWHGFMDGEALGMRDGDKSCIMVKMYDLSSIRRINSALSDPTQRFQDSTIIVFLGRLNALYQLKSHYFSTEQSQEIQAHLQGIRYLMRKRGGFMARCNESAISWNTIVTELLSFGEISAGTTPLSLHASSTACAAPSAVAATSNLQAGPLDYSFGELAQEYIGAFQNFFSAAQIRKPKRHSSALVDSGYVLISQLFSPGKYMTRLLTNPTCIGHPRIFVVFFLYIILWDNRDDLLSLFNDYFRRVRISMRKEILDLGGSTDLFLWALITDPDTHKIECVERLWLLARLLRIHVRLTAHVQACVIEALVRFIVTEDKVPDLPLGFEIFRSVVEDNLARLWVDDKEITIKQSSV